MFVWAPIPPNFKSSMDFWNALVEKTGIICTPGNAFGPMGEGYVRFALVLPAEELSHIVFLHRLLVRENGTSIDRSI